MFNIEKKNKKISLLGLIVGLINSLLGAGGGMLAVPILKKSGLSQTEAHATSIAVILPITIISTVIYAIKGNVPFDGNLWFLLYGAIGAVIGGIILKKIPQKVLKKIFACFIIWAAIRMFFK